MYLWLLDPANWFLPIPAAAVRDNKGATSMTDFANAATAANHDADTFARNLEADLATFQATIANMTTFADKIASRIATAIANASELAATVAAMSGEIAALRSQVEELSDRVADRDAVAAERDNLRLELETVRDQLRAEQETSKRHWDSLTEANAALDTARTSLTAADQELTDARFQITDLTNRKQELGTINDELTRDLEAKIEEKRDLAVQLESVRQEYAAYREQTTTLADDLRSQVETANGKVVEAEAASQARAERLIELGEEVARIRADFEVLNSTRLDEIRALADERDTLRAALTTIMSAVHGVSAVLAPTSEPAQPDVPVAEVVNF